MSNPEIEIQNPDTTTVLNNNQIAATTKDDDKFSVRDLKKLWPIIRSDYFPFEVIFLIVCLVIGIFNLEEFWVSSCLNKIFF